MNLEAGLFEQGGVSVNGLVHSAAEAVIENVAILPADAQIFVTFEQWLRIIHNTYIEGNQERL